MKRSIIISAIAFSTLTLSAQKSTNPYIHDSRADEGATADRRIHSESDHAPMYFINCWIHPMSNSINSEYPEYTPVFNQNGNTMFFTSRRPGNVGNKKTIDPTYKAEDVYFSTKDSEGNWSKAMHIHGKVNTNKNEAVTWVSENGNDMILCENEDLYESHLANGAWSKPVPMAAINSDYRETHASISPDGNTIYFTTDNPEMATAGGLDICKIERDPSGEWKKPVIVENINSALNEDDPTLMDDGKTLYFSSQGFGSLGGYDIYKSTMNAEHNFGTPVNLGFPLNTEANEPFISFTANKTKAYLSSDRGDKKEQNIYEVTLFRYDQYSIIG